MLTFVPTPLGNLRDVTLRALDALRTCDVIVAEDTRVALRLLRALDLPRKPLRSYREHNAASVTDEIVALAAERAVVVVSDAGTPGISDPGSALVRAARCAGVALEVLPGPCAFVTAAVLSGFAFETLTFAGFVPRRAGERTAALSRALRSDAITAFYESPQRIVASLEALAALDSSASVFVARELTKRFEQHIAGNPRDVLATIERPVRGEIVLVIAGNAANASAGSPQPAGLDAAIDAELAKGTKPAIVAKALARAGFGERAQLYRRIAERVAADRARR